MSNKLLKEAEEIPERYAKWIWDLIDQLALARVRIKELEEALREKENA